jgi:CHAT domain-containing protein
MFEAAQLAQGSVTSQQIALATARLAENARDPKVGTAIRSRQDAEDHLHQLIRTRELATAARTANEPQTAVDPVALEKQISDAQASLADADAALQAASPNYGQLVQQVTSAKEIFADLAPEEAFAAIIDGQADGWVFVLHAGQVAAARTGLSARTVADLVRQIRAGIEPTTTDLPHFNSDAAHRLYAATLGRVEPALSGAKSLIVAPSGPMLSLPFAVLLTGPATSDLAAAPWLVRRFAITHVPSPANFIGLRKIAGGSRATHPWFGFGDFIPSTLAQARGSFAGRGCADSAQLFAGLPTLAFAAQELDTARAVLGGSPGDQLLGAAFTSAAVRHADLKSDRILHFATHALLPSELRCVDEPAIVTSNPPGATNVAGALLTASQITGLDLDADAVILSACNTGGADTAGEGAEGSGESLSGLARAFFYAGARALMVTHWSVNDQAAAFLVADTLRRVHAGEAAGLAVALRGAELTLLDHAGKNVPAEFAHPFFWAPFAVIGEGGGARLAAGSRAGL